MAKISSKPGGQLFLCLMVYENYLGVTGDISRESVVQRYMKGDTKITSTVTIVEVWVCGKGNTGGGEGRYRGSVSLGVGKLCRDFMLLLSNLILFYVFFLMLVK